VERQHVLESVDRQLRHRQHLVNGVRDGLPGRLDGGHTCASSTLERGGGRRCRGVRPGRPDRGTPVIGVYPLGGTFSPIGGRVGSTCRRVKGVTSSPYIRFAGDRTSAAPEPGVDAAAVPVLLGGCSILPIGSGAPRLVPLRPTPCREDG